MGTHGNIQKHTGTQENTGKHTWKHRETHGNTWEKMGKHGNTPHVSQTPRCCHAGSAPPWHSQPRQSWQPQLSLCSATIPALHSQHRTLPCPASSWDFGTHDKDWGQLTTPASRLSLGKAEHSQLGPQELFACREAKTSHFQSGSTAEAVLHLLGRGWHEKQPHTHPIPTLLPPNPPPAPRGGVAPC